MFLNMLHYVDFLMWYLFHVLNLNQIFLQLACSPPQCIFVTEHSEQQKVDSARYRVMKFFESISEIEDLHFMNVNEATIKIILELMGTVRINYAEACVKSVHKDAVRLVQSSHFTSFFSADLL